MSKQNLNMSKQKQWSLPLPGGYGEDPICSNVWLSFKDYDLLICLSLE